MEHDILIGLRSGKVNNTMKNKDAEKIIELNFRFSQIIKRHILREKNLEKKLDLIEYYLHFCTNNFTGYYSDAKIEQCLLEYSKLIDYKRKQSYKKNTSLIVMTQAFKIGGHTPISSNWINQDSDRVYSLVVTNGYSRKFMPDFLIDSVEKSGGQVYYLDETKSKIEQAKELLDIAQSFEYVFLNIHMFDVVPVIAFGHENWDTPIYFYHHANFLFTVGISITDRMFCLCEFDKRKALEYRGVTDAVVLPYPPELNYNIGGVEIVSNDEKKELMKKYAEKYGFNVNCKIVLSMGAEFKYSKVDNMDFCAFAKNVVNKCDVNIVFIIIGPDPNSIRWKKLKEDTHGKAQAIGLQDRNVVTELMKISDCFVTCFPMGAAGSVEAFKYGNTIFRYSPTGRFNETAIINSNFSDIELMEKELIDVVNSNKIVNQEFVSYTKDIFGYDLWSDLLDDVLTVSNHNVNKYFSSNRAVEIEEIINIQLLRKENYPYLLSRRKEPIMCLMDYVYHKKKKKMFEKYDEEI